MEYKDCTVHSRTQIVLDQGEKVLETLTSHCEKRGIKSGIITALGAVRNATVGYYRLSDKQYVFKEYPEDLELVSLIGNVSLVDDKPFIHAHVTLGNPDMQLVGGHLKEAEVAVTLEVHLIDFNETFMRSHDETIGLNLLNFKRTHL